MAEYLRLSAEDAPLFFDIARRRTIPCPACESDERTVSFTKNGFAYAVCHSCSTLYQSPRPPLEQFERFYRDSRSADFWARVFFPGVAEARRERLFVPRVARVGELCKAAALEPVTVIEVGAGFGIFLEEWKKVHPKTEVRAVEPHPDMAEVCRTKGVNVLEEVVENSHAWHGQGDLVACFEVIEHAHDPLGFVRAIRALLRPGGLLVMTGLGVEGFDIQILWERSKSVFPPHHLNFMSVRGFETLMRRAGFDDVSVITPGVLDVELVQSAVAADRGTKLSRFETTLLGRGPGTLAQFQRFLAEHRLSSHVWVSARRSRQERAP